MFENDVVVAKSAKSAKSSDAKSSICCMQKVQFVLTAAPIGTAGDITY